MNEWIIFCVLFYIFILKKAVIVPYYNIYREVPQIVVKISKKYTHD